MCRYIICMHVWAYFGDFGVQPAPNWICPCVKSLIMQKIRPKSLESPRNPQTSPNCFQIRPRMCAYVSVLVCSIFPKSFKVSSVRHQVQCVRSAELLQILVLTESPTEWRYINRWLLPKLQHVVCVFGIMDCFANVNNLYCYRTVKNNSLIHLNIKMQCSSSDLSSFR